jgi:hypothetical protein
VYENLMMMYHVRRIYDYARISASACAATYVRAVRPEQVLLEESFFRALALASSDSLSD